MRRLFGETLGSGRGVKFFFGLCTCRIGVRRVRRALVAILYEYKKVRSLIHAPIAQQSVLRSYEPVTRGRHPVGAKNLCNE